MFHFFSFQPSQLWAEHKQSVQIALNIPSWEVREGLLAAQKEFHEYGQPSKVDDLTKLASIDEKELGYKVTEIRQTINKSIWQDIINIYGTESVLTKDTAKKGILGVIPILLFLSTMKLVNEVSSLSSLSKNVNSKLLLLFSVLGYAATFCNT